MRSRASAVEYASAPAPPAARRAALDAGGGASASREASATSVSAASARACLVMCCGRDTENSPSSSLRLRRAAEIVAQEHAHGDALAVALGRAEVHPPHGRRDLLVESVAGPAHYPYAPHAAVGVYLDRGVHGGLGLGARGGV